MHEQCRLHRIPAFPRPAVNVEEWDIVLNHSTAFCISFVKLMIDIDTLVVDKIIRSLLEELLDTNTLRLARVLPTSKFTVRHSIQKWLSVGPFAEYPTYDVFLLVNMLFNINLIEIVV